MSDSEAKHKAAHLSFAPLAIDQEAQAFVKPQRLMRHYIIGSGIGDVTAQEASLSNEPAASS
jgi:hypothetical protein